MCAAAKISARPALSLAASRITCGGTMRSRRPPSHRFGTLKPASCARKSMLSSIAKPEINAAGSGLPCAYTTSRNQRSSALSFGEPSVSNAKKRSTTPSQSRASASLKLLKAFCVMPFAQSAVATKQGELAISTKDCTAAGKRSASCVAIAPPNDQPTKVAGAKGAR